MTAYTDIDLNRPKAPYVANLLSALIAAGAIIGAALVGAGASLGTNYLATQDKSTPASQYELWNADPTAAGKGLLIIKLDRSSGKTWRLVEDNTTKERVWAPLNDLPSPPTPAPSTTRP